MCNSELNIVTHQQKQLQIFPPSIPHPLRSSICRKVDFQGHKSNMGANNYVSWEVTVGRRKEENHIS